MARYDADLTKVRLFPNFPADELKVLWEKAIGNTIAEFPTLTANQRNAVVLRRIQEHCGRPQDR